MSVSYINSHLFQKMNTRRNAGWGRREATVGVNQVLPQDPAEEVSMLVKLVGLIDVEVRTYLS